jgi:hypothetical protein
MIALLLWFLVILSHGFYRVGLEIGLERGEKIGEDRMERLLLPHKFLRW